MVLGAESSRPSVPASRLGRLLVKIGSGGKDENTGAPNKTLPPTLPRTPSSPTAGRVLCCTVLHLHLHLHHTAMRVDARRARAQLDDSTWLATLQAGRAGRVR